MTQQRLYQLNPGTTTPSRLFFFFLPGDCSSVSYQDSLSPSLSPAPSLSLSPNMTLFPLTASCLLGLVNPARGEN